MESLIKTLPAILSAAGPSAEVAAAACFAAWKHTVGEALSIHTVPLKLENQTLIVAVADNIWQRQLEQIRPQLLFRLNTVLGHSLVKLIELRIDPNALPKTRMPQGMPKHHPDSAVPFELRAAASEIQDADLRRAFLGAATSCLKRLETNSQSET
jgi:predicted nucleic acid-binding Zn ribbon protein